jgi:hypothetical protein
LVCLPDVYSYLDLDLDLDLLEGLDSYSAVDLACQTSASSILDFFDEHVVDLSLP